MVFVIEEELESSRIFKIRYNNTSCTSDADDGDSNNTVTNNSKQYYVMKMEDDEFKDNIQHEYNIGVELNKLNIPNFVNTVDLVVGNRGLQYCTSEGGKVLPCVFFDIDCNKQFLITSFVHGTPLHEIEDINVIKCCLVQLLCLLDYMCKEYGFTHYDLHWANIIVVDLISQHKIVYPNYTIQTRYVPVIIDYGRAHTTQTGGFDSLSNDSTFVKAEPNFRHDLIYLLYSYDTSCCESPLLVELINELRSLYGLPLVNLDDEQNSDSDSDEQNNKIEREKQHQTYEQLFNISCDDRTLMLQSTDHKIKHVSLQQLMELDPQLFIEDRDDGNLQLPVYCKSSQLDLTHELDLDHTYQIPQKYLFVCRNMKYHHDMVKYVLDTLTYGNNDDTVEQFNQLDLLSERLIQQQKDIVGCGVHYTCSRYCDCNDDNDIPETHIHMLTGTNPYCEHKDIGWCIQIFTTIKQHLDHNQLQQVIDIFNDWANNNEYGCENNKTQSHNDMKTSLFITFFYMVAGKQIYLNTTSSIFGSNDLADTTDSYYNLKRFGNEYY